MDSIDRYVLRTVLGAFAMILGGLTAFIWVTQALREIDLMTNQGQTVLVFVGMTGLLIPILILVIAPIALVVAVAYVLNKLNGDSEIVVMNASGISPWRLFRPFVISAAIVSILVGSISVYIAPKSLRELRSWAARVKTDLVTTFFQPGRFTKMGLGLTVHIRERRPDGRLVGIFIDDRRVEKERVTFLAEQGEIIENKSGTFIVMETGSVQRQDLSQRDPAIVQFDRNAFDLSQFNSGADARAISFRERYLWDLVTPDPTDPVVMMQPAQLRAELHDRIITLFYPFAFVVIAYAFLGIPSTTRQSRAVSMGMTIAGVTVLRFFGFGCLIFSAQTGWAIVLLYATVFAVIGIGLWGIQRGQRLEPPAALLQFIDRIGERLSPRTKAAAVR